MDYKAILNLMKEMNQTDLTKLEIESEGVRICMEKGSNVAVQPAFPQIYHMPAPSAQFQVPAAVTAAPAAAPAQESAPASFAASESAADNNPGYKKILSPMVGTFYLQPSPDKAAFVKQGDTVKKGQTVCIIEAMKLMNEIESEFDGEIVEVLVGNEEMVEFGQPLFTIK